MSAVLDSAQTVRSGFSTLTTDGPLPIKPENYPKPTEEALEFIETVLPSDFDDIIFDDELATFSETGKELGEFKVTVTPAKKLSQDCILIHANSHGIIDGVPCGTSIIAYISKSLVTLEQQHHEYVKLENYALDKKTILTKAEGEYHLSRTVSQGDKLEKTNHSFSAADMKGFISEASNLILSRLLIKKGLPSNFHVISFDSDANLCKSPYTQLASKSQTIDDEPIIVTGLQRSIESLSDIPTIWHSYFDQYGHLTSRVQVGSPAIMKVIKVPEAILKDERADKPVFTKQKLIWDDDPEMFSKYQDRKSELEDDHAMYLRHHPEVKCLLADFMQFLLLRKPKDVLNFAGEYFASFSSRAVEPSAYATSLAPTPFPPSRTNTIMSINQKVNKKKETANT